MPPVADGVAQGERDHRKEGEKREGHEDGPAPHVVEGGPGEGLPAVLVVHDKGGDEQPDPA